jgi:hypothetical protein
MADIASKPWLKRYDLRIGHYDWASVVIGSDGFFAACSSWGGYAYRWGAMGCADAREFFLDKEYARYPDYILSKLCGARDVYDGDATCANVKRAIIEARRHGPRSAEWARREWDLLREHGNLESREDYALWYQETRIDDAYEHAAYVYPNQAQGFVRNVMPVLADAIRAELAAEKRVA